MSKKFLILILALSLLIIGCSENNNTGNVDNDHDSTINYNPITYQIDGNPIVRHLRAADPDVHVWNDGKLWMYTSQDHDPLPGDSTNYARMDGYHVFSTEDMVTWTDHGEILHSRDVEWGMEGGGWMWAPGAAYKDGTYYLYFPHKDKSGNWRTGVATSKKPQGPFKDIGNYIAGTFGIDPMCFIDDDGQAYLYFDKKVAKLKPNMIELAESPRAINYGVDESNPANAGIIMKEAPEMHKRNGIYYFSYSNWTNDTNQGFYAMGNSPYGPFTYKGAVNKRPSGAQDHHSIEEYKGKWYYFYHVGNYTNESGEVGKGYRRNSCVDYLYFNSDGTMQMVQQTSKGVSKVN